MSQKRRRQSKRGSTESSDTRRAPSQADYAKMICEIAEKLGYPHDYASVMKMLADPNDPRNQPMYTYPGVRPRVSVIQGVTLELHLVVNNTSGSRSTAGRLLWRICHSLLPPVSGNMIPDKMEAAEKIVQEFLSDSMKSAQTTA